MDRQEPKLNKSISESKLQSNGACGENRRLLDLFPRIITQMLSYKNQSQLMSFFVNKVAEIFQARKVSLMLVDPESKELSIKASYGLSPSANSTKIKLGQMFGGWVAQEGSSLLVKDVEKEFPDLGKDRLSRYRTKSFIIVPIVIKEGVIGILNITDRKDIAIFTENDLKTINFLCYILASYIENIKLFKINTKLIAVDVLTGLFNHRHFQEHLLEEIYHAERYRHPLSLLMLDIDNFSLYNQTYGYSSGDSALKQIARIIKENTRRVDIVARYGPEEFMIILPSTRLKQAMVAAERIRQKISYSIFVENRKSSLGMDRLTVSIGVVEHKVGITKEELLRRVKNALLRAKQKGKNCIQVFK